MASATQLAANSTPQLTLVGVPEKGCMCGGKPQENCIADTRQDAQDYGTNLILSQPGWATESGTLRHQTIIEPGSNWPCGLLTLAYCACKTQMLCVLQDSQHCRRVSLALKLQTCTPMIMTCHMTSIPTYSHTTLSANKNQHSMLAQHHCGHISTP
jgi:hypothetical protein